MNDPTHRIETGVSASPEARAILALLDELNTLLTGRGFQSYYTPGMRWTAYWLTAGGEGRQDLWVSVEDIVRGADGRASFGPDTLYIQYLPADNSQRERTFEHVVLALPADTPDLLGHVVTALGSLSGPA